MTNSPPSLQHPIPLGFGAQLKALQASHQAQAVRIAALERETTLLKASPSSRSSSADLVARLEALEAYNTRLSARRREAVAQLLTLRPLHQESANAFQVRAKYVEADDFEGMVVVYGTSVTTVLNQHQRALGLLRGGARMGYASAVHGGVVHGYGYPVVYAQAGWCVVHQQGYPCRGCGQ